MPGEIRRGGQAIQEATEGNNSGGSTFKPFLPNIYWKENKEEKYVLILNPIEDIPSFDMITFIPQEGSKAFGMTVAKTDPYFDERVDPFVANKGAKERTVNVAIAIELEPNVSNVNGRPRPTKFEVKTKDFERRILDEEGEVTEETETVTTPVVGTIVQSPNNFFSVLKQHDETDWPIHETPIKIVRVGKDQNTSYSVTGFESQDIDLSNLFDYLDGVTYLGDETEALKEEVATIREDNEVAAALEIGKVLLDLKLEELTDPDIYDELYEKCHESMDRFGNNSKSTQRTEATKRPSQRKPQEKVEKPKKKVTSNSSPEDKISELKSRLKNKDAVAA